MTFNMSDPPDISKHPDYQWQKDAYEGMESMWRCRLWYAVGHVAEKVNAHRLYQWAMDRSVRYDPMGKVWEHAWNGEDVR